MAEEAVTQPEPVVEEAQVEEPPKIEETDAPKVDDKAAEIEQIARDKGWKPEEEFQGDSGTWIPAKEFLLREPLFDTIKRQGKELKGLKKTLESMSNQFQTQVAAQVQLKIRELKEQRREAIQDQDVDRVEQLDEEIASQQSTINETTKQQNQLPDEVVEWIAENPWFEKDQELNAWAITHNKTYIQQHPGDIAGSLEATAKAVKKAFPEKFEKPKPQTAPNPVPSGDEPKGANGGNKWSVSRLTEDQRNVYNQLVKQHGTLSHDEYFKGLEEIGELQ